MTGWLARSLARWLAGSLADSLTSCTHAHAHAHPHPHPHPHPRMHTRTPGSKGCRRRGRRQPHGAVRTSGFLWFSTTVDRVIDADSWQMQLTRNEHGNEVAWCHAGSAHGSTQAAPGGVVNRFSHGCSHVRNLRVPAGHFKMVPLLLVLWLYCPGAQIMSSYTKGRFASRSSCAFALDVFEISLSGFLWG